MEPKPSPAGVFPHKNKPSSIHISQQSQETSTGAATTNLIAPLTPRIDISRASSSSYHEDSSPENVFDQVTFFEHSFIRDFLDIKAKLTLNIYKL